MALKIDHLTIMVSSFDKSIAYYNRLLCLLGFNKLREHVWSDDDGFVFQFSEAKAGTHQYQRFGAGMNHLGFSAPNAKFVEAIRENMKNAGFEVPKIQHLNGATALFMKDPDGIRFEVTYYPPGVSIVD